MNQLSSAIDNSLMKSKISEAFVAGVDRVSAWADLLDSINVFPVADGDTGRNLVISLQPLRQPFDDQEELIEALLLSARGNSGNIAAQFFSAFVSIEILEELTEISKQGRDLAWKAVTEPKSGTMLSIFDALVESRFKSMMWYQIPRVSSRTSRTGQGFGFRIQKSRKEKASRFGNMTRLACT